MKKYILFFAISLTLSFALVSCDTETDVEPGGTNIEKMCGYWDVVYDAVDENGELVYEDFFDMGVVPFYTYNTNDNSESFMYVDDLEEFWEFKFKANIDYNARTFWALDLPYDEEGIEETATITDGKILEGAARNSHGMPNDSISFYISFSDDPYPEAYGYAKYHVHGQRHTGFSPDAE